MPNRWHHKDTPHPLHSCSDFSCGDKCKIIAYRISQKHVPHHGSHALLCQTCQNMLLINFNYIPHEMCKIAQITRLESAARGVSAQGPPSTSEPKQNTELHSQKYIQQTWLVVTSLPWACFETRSDRACWPVTLLGLYSESKLSSASAWLPNQNFALCQPIRQGASASSGRHCSRWPLQAAWPRRPCLFGLSSSL